MREYYPNYLKFIDDALELAKNIPRYFSKFSNKIYCNHQKLAIFVLMQKLRTTSRGIVSWLRCNQEAKLHLGLTRVPVHTTILRFAKNVNKLIGNLIGIHRADTVAVDATGFELESKSYYYRTKWNSKGKIKRKEYMKLSIVIDTDKQTILNYKIRKKLRNDTVDFKNLVKDLSVKKVIADKGYDSKSNRQFVINKLKAIPIIPKRGYKLFYGYIKGKRKISGVDYHQRSKIETVFSVIKRKYGSVLRTRSFIMQKVEVISKLIAYNLDKKLFLILRVAPEPFIFLSYLRIILCIHNAYDLTDSYYNIFYCLFKVFLPLFEIPVLSC